MCGRITKKQVILTHRVDNQIVLLFCVRAKKKTDLDSRSVFSCIIAPQFSRFLQKLPRDLFRFEVYAVDANRRSKLWTRSRPANLVIRCPADFGHEFCRISWLKPRLLWLSFEKKSYDSIRLLWYKFQQQINQLQIFQFNDLIFRFN